MFWIKSFWWLKVKLKIIRPILFTIQTIKEESHIRKLIFCLFEVALDIVFFQLLIISFFTNIEKSLNLSKQNRMDELVNQGLIIIEKVFDNVAGNDVISETMNVCDNLCESERFGRMWEDLVTGQGDVTEIAEKFIWLAEFHGKWN